MNHTEEMLVCLAIGSFFAWRNKPDTAQSFLAVALYFGLRLLFQF